MVSIVIWWAFQVAFTGKSTVSCFFNYSEISLDTTMSLDWILFLSNASLDSIASVDSFSNPINLNLFPFSHPNSDLQKKKIHFDICKTSTDQQQTKVNKAQHSICIFHSPYTFGFFCLPIDIFSIGFRGFNTKQSKPKSDSLENKKQHLPSSNLNTKAALGGIRCTWRHFSTNSRALKRGR